MLVQLESYFSLMELSRVRCLDYVFSNQLKIKKPMSGWSTEQVLEHLVLVDEKTLESIQKYRNVQKKIGIRSSLSSFLLNQFLRFPYRYSVPKNAEIQPDINLSARQSARRWIENRTKWHQILNEFSATQLDVSAFKHPYAGFLTISQTMLFIHYHTAHHIHQLRRINKAENKNGQ